MKKQVDGPIASDMDEVVGELICTVDGCEGAGADGAGVSGGACSAAGRLCLSHWHGRHCRRGGLGPGTVPLSPQLHHRIASYMPSSSFVLAAGGIAKIPPVNSQHDRGLIRAGLMFFHPTVTSVVTLSFAEVPADGSCTQGCIAL